MNVPTITTAARRQSARAAISHKLSGMAFLPTLGPQIQAIRRYGRFTGNNRALIPGPALPLTGADRRPLIKSTQLQSWGGASGRPTFFRRSSIALRPAAVIRILTTSTVFPSAITTSRSLAASRRRTRLESTALLKPRLRASICSLTPCELPASSSKARRCSGPRRRFRGDFPNRNSSPSFSPSHLLITPWRKPPLPHPACRPSPDWAAGSASQDMPRGSVARTSAISVPDDHLPVDAADDRVFNHGVVITVRPIAWFPALNAGLGSLPA